MNTEVTYRGHTYTLDELQKHLTDGRFADGSNIPVEATVIGLQLCAYLRWAQEDAETSSRLHTEALVRIHTLEAA